MHWVASLENQQAVESLFGDAGDFSCVDLHEVVLGREGPVLRLRFDVPVVPKRPPSKWPPGANATQFVIAAWGAESISISGWDSEVSGLLSVSHSANKALLSFVAPNCQVRAWFSMLRVEQIAGYINAQRRA